MVDTGKPHFLPPGGTAPFKLGDIAKMPKTATETVGEINERARLKFIKNVEALMEAVQGVFDAEGLDSEHRRKARTALKKAFAPFTPFTDKEKKK